MFSQNESGRISDEYVAVKLTGGADTTPEVSAFMSRYGVRGFPTLLVMNADGHVVNNRVGRTTDQIMGAIAQGEANEASFAKVEAAAKAEGADQVATDAYLSALEDRMGWDSLIAHYEAAESDATRDSKLAGFYAKVGRADDELKMLGEMITKYPEADERPDWRIRVASSAMDGVNSRETFTSIVPGVIEKLQALAAAAEAEGDKATAAKAYVQAGGYLAHGLIGKTDEGMKLLDMVLEKYADSPAAPDALMGKVNAAWGAKDYVACKAALERIVADYPDSEHAKNAPRLIQRVQQMIDGAR